MYEADIRDLKEQLSAKDNQIRKLQKNNKALRQQFESRKSESKMHYCRFSLDLTHFCNYIDHVCNISRFYYCSLIIRRFFYRK